MTLTNTQTASIWRRTLDRMEVVGLLAIPTVLPLLIFMALLILQHHTN